jgi:hypothetical protein
MLDILSVMPEHRLAAPEHQRTDRHTRDTHVVGRLGVLVRHEALPGPVDQHDGKGEQHD